MSGVPYVATLSAALGCGLVAGVLFAFSSFVMPALGRLPHAEGVAAMQSINRLAVTPAFMTALFGTGVLCLGLIVWAVASFDGWSSALMLVGGALYVLGAIGVTILFNVPLNDALAKVHPGSADAAVLWATYLTNWTAWNHARTITALAAAALLILSLRV
ncbi:MAG: DUF1772 domain-containing protein [Rubrobacteraceae bacterium]